MKKRLLAIALMLTMVFASMFALVACNSDESAEGDVEKAIAAAEKMTLKELEAAAQKELEDNPTLTFNADSLTSGIKKALAAFEEKYTWAAGRTAYNSKKGSEYQPKLTAAYESNAYIADFVMIQDASFVKSLTDANFLLSYVPSDDGITIAESDQNPLVGVTFNKVFMYNNSNVGVDQLKNVWQLTGADGSSLNGISNLSFQSPLGEDVNMSFLIMLTSDDACEKLTSAYKSYFGTDYDASQDDYANIGYKFVAEFIANVSVWHTSDSTQVKEINAEDKQDGRVIFAGLCKLKDYAGYKVDETDPTYYKTIVSAAGWNIDVEGFPGFVYNMWTLIPSTAKLPYTACLFVRYILSSEGYNAGWGGILGYYSSNSQISSVDGDPSLAEWKNMAIVEDVNYVNSAYSSVVKFINQQLAAASK